MGKCCEGVLWRSVVEKCCREVLWRSVIEKWRREVLWWCGAAFVAWCFCCVWFCFYMEFWVCFCFCLVEECCREVLEKSVGEKCWRSVIWKSVGEKCCREAL